MSLILDALNRSRQDSEQMPGLASVHPVESAAKGSNPLQWLLVGALALAVLLIAWLLFDRLPRPAPVAAVAAVAPALPDTVAPLPIPAPKPSPAPTPAGEPAADAASTPALSRPPPAAAERQAEAAASAPAQPAPAPVDASVAALYQDPEQAAPAPAEPRGQTASPAPQARAPVAEREEVPVDVERLLAAAREELAEAHLSEHEVPFLSALSQQTKDSIPTLMYQQHDYASDSARSSVVINGKTLQVGATASGVKVEEILPDSVVLEYRGSRFRLRALNSWVNL